MERNRRKNNWDYKGKETMNIDVVGRIRPPIRGEGPVSLHIDTHNQISAQKGGSLFSFQQLHKDPVKNPDVFRASVEPLLDLWLAGYNTCLLVTGESGSGKAYTVAGESGSGTGMVPLILETLFARIGEDDGYMYDTQSRPHKRVSLQMYEIYNELIKDLLQVPGVTPTYLDTDDLPGTGPHIQDLTSLTLKRVDEGTSSFRQAWSRRTDTYTDFGPARNHTATVINLDLHMSGDNPLPNHSRFSIVLTPGAEKFSDDVSALRVREGSTLSKSMVTLGQVVSNLSKHPYPDRAINYGDSKLTYLLQEELGGNCKTRVLLCLKPQADTKILGPILSMCKKFSEVKNFPVLNDPLAQQLITQYRARIISLQQEVGQETGMTLVHDPGEELRRIQSENLQLRDTNERLHLKLQQLQARFGDVATVKTDLSAQLLMTEEEKLKVSKTLVEMQIENNKLKEDAEQIKFELTNRVLQLESELVELELDRDRHSKASRNAREKLTELESDRKELADEYVVLKTNFINLQRAHEAEVSRNEELGLELLNLVNAKSTVMKNYGKRDISIDAEEEVQRVRAIVSRLSSRKLEPEDRTTIEKNLFGGQTRFDREMSRLKRTYDDDHIKLQARISEHQKENNEVRNAARERQKKYAELNAKYLSQKNKVERLQTENNHMQHKLKDINNEFRTRLVKYVGDIADYVDNGGLPGHKGNKDMKQYVENMLADLKKSHKVREEQLSQAAQSYRQQIQRVTQRHEQLLVAYRDLREQIEDSRLGDDIRLGPDETELQMSDSELVSQQQKQISRLRDQLNQARGDLEALGKKAELDLDDQARASGSILKPSFSDTKPTSDSAPADWGSLRRQLREFTVNTQQELENERSQLLTKNAMLEEEVKDLQEYIDSHLTRYRDEIVRLQSLLGNKSTGFNSPGGPSRYNDRHRNHRR